MRSIKKFATKLQDVAQLVVRAVQQVRNGRIVELELFFIVAATCDSFPLVRVMRSTVRHKSTISGWFRSF